MAVELARFKSALRRWASGVTIVTARAGERELGMTVSAFSSVSLDPPLVLVCADKKAHTNPLIAEGGVFAVNVLAERPARALEPLRDGRATRRSDSMGSSAGAGRAARRGCPTRSR